jgi:hypothetical protein
VSGSQLVRDSNPETAAGGREFLLRLNLDLMTAEQADQATATLEWDEEKCMRFSTRIPRLNFMESITVMFQVGPT